MCLYTLIGSKFYQLLCYFWCGWVVFTNWFHLLKYIIWWAKVAINLYTSVSSKPVFLLVEIQCNLICQEKKYVALNKSVLALKDEWNQSTIWKQIKSGRIAEKDINCKLYRNTVFCEGSKHKGIVSDLVSSMVNNQSV